METMRDGERALWNTAETTVKIHRAGCAMLNRANKRRGMVLLTNADDVLEMAERGYDVTRCRCAAQEVSR